MLNKNPFYRYVFLGAFLCGLIISPRSHADERVTLLTDDGGRVDWSPQNLIAFDRRGPDGYYNVWTMDPDGSDQTCLTCNKPGAPTKNKGNPAWHPSGQYIVFEGQRDQSSKLLDHLAEPGRGVANDLWVMDASGTHYWKIVDSSNGWKPSGVLHPHFSFDGKKLFWSQLFKKDGTLGDWQLLIADFSVLEGVPVISNIQTLQVWDENNFYESHGFTPEGEQVLFTARTGRQSADEFLMDLATGKSVNLTGDDGSWNEHGQINPDGRSIVWASSRGMGRKGLNLWRMGIDGTKAHEVIDFHDPALPYYSIGIGPGDSSWSPEGKKLAVYCISDKRETKGKIYLIEFSSSNT